MNKRLMLALAAVGVLGTAAGCAHDRAKNDTAGEKVDRANEKASDAAENAGDKVENAADKSGDAVENAGDKAEDATDPK